VQSFTGLPEAERWFSVQNGTPGLQKLEVTVNKTKPLRFQLRDGQTQEADLATRLQPGDGNTLKLVGYGKPGSRALVTVGDAPGPGSRPALRVQALAPGGRPVNLEWHR
jgi:hypothetical protein